MPAAIAAFGTGFKAIAVAGSLVVDIAVVGAN
jgi:hypothetical protein